MQWSVTSMTLQNVKFSVFTSDFEVLSPGVLREQTHKNTGWKIEVCFLLKTMIANRTISIIWNNLKLLAPIFRREKAKCADAAFFLFFPAKKIYAALKIVHSPSHFVQRGGRILSQIPKKGAWEWAHRSFLICLHQEVSPALPWREKTWNGVCLP